MTAPLLVTAPETWREAIGPMESQFQSPLCGGEEVKNPAFSYIVLSVPFMAAQNSSHYVQCLGRDLQRALEAASSEHTSESFF